MMTVDFGVCMCVYVRIVIVLYNLWKKMLPTRYRYLEILTGTIDSIHKEWLLYWKYDQRQDFQWQDLIKLVKPINLQKN